jgi:hypothetical protein
VRKLFKYNTNRDTQEVWFKLVIPFWCYNVEGEPKDKTYSTEAQQQKLRRFPHVAQENGGIACQKETQQKSEGKYLPCNG